MGQCKGKSTPKCKAIFKKYNEKGTYNKADANITPRSKKSKSVNGLSGAPKKRKTTRKSLSGLNGFGTTTWVLITGIILLAVGVGGWFGAEHYKSMQMNAIIDEQETQSKAKAMPDAKKAMIEKLKKLNVLEVHNFRNVLQAVREGKLTEEKMTDKQKGYYKKTGFSLPNVAPAPAPAKI